ncbi:hypothetical protein HDU86_000310 [Geranomyces michiganensis]|nr:hypothetical protein HDU86_000310 [Geranomyces michiganensis]
MPPSKETNRSGGRQAAGGGRKKTYRGTTSEKPHKAKPYARHELNKNGGLNAKARPAAASRTASKLAALGLASLSQPQSSAATPSFPSASSRADTARPPTKSQLVVQKMQDEDLLDSVDAELGSVMAVLSERQAEKAKAKGSSANRRNDAKRKAESKQREFEKTETDMDSALASLNAL